MTKQALRKNTKGEIEMMKKSVFITTGLLVLLSGGYFVSEEFSKDTVVKSNVVSASPQSELQKVYIEAKTDYFGNLDELTEKSPIIVKGFKESEVRTEVFKSKINESVIGGYTVADFKITEVIKNEATNSKINLDQSIPIAELNFEAEGAVYSTNGYEKMNEGNEYLLFLTDEQDGVFATRGVTVGKIPLDSNETEIFDNYLLDSEIESIKDIFNEARIEYDK